jgi:hypothetical protein
MVASGWDERALTFDIRRDGRCLSVSVESFCGALRNHVHGTLPDPLVEDLWTGIPRGAVHMTAWGTTRPSLEV